MSQAVVVTSPGSTVVQSTKTQAVVARVPSTAVVKEMTPITVVVTRAIPGPPGRDGDASGALLAANKLSEFASDPEDQLAAQQNLGLGSVDPLAYYILAKA